MTKTIGETPKVVVGGGIDVADSPRDVARFPGCEVRAGVPIRAVAVLVDSLFAALVIGLPLAVITDQTWSSGDTRGFKLNGNTQWLWLLLALAYATIMEATIGATVGKLVLGLRVRHRDGTRVGWRGSIIRNALRIVDAFPYLIPYLVGALAALEDKPERQRLGDRPARTVVVFRD